MNHQILTGFYGYLNFDPEVLRSNNTDFEIDEEVTIIFEVGTVITPELLYPHIKDIITSGDNVDLILDNNYKKIQISTSFGRSITRVSTASQLSSIDTHDIIAFAYIEEDFGNNKVGDMLFHNGNYWVPIY